MLKHDIFTCENNMISSFVKRSPLLRLTYKWCLLQWKWNGLEFHCCWYYSKYHLEIWNFFWCWKIFHLLSQRERKISAWPCNNYILSFFSVVCKVRLQQKHGGKKYFLCHNWPGLRRKSNLVVLVLANSSKNHNLGLIPEGMPALVTVSGYFQQN